MKNAGITIIVVLLFASPVLAKDTLSSEVLADPSKYIGKTVTMTGLFVHSETARESFIMDQNGTQVEVFIRSLPKINKDFILSQKPNSKIEISVIGVVQGYANKQNSFYLNASALQNANGSFQAFSRGIAANMADVLADPPSFIGKSITMTGMFSYGEPMRESFALNQNGTLIEVFLWDIPKPQKDYLYSLEQGAKVEITVTGVLQVYANKANTYFMNATSLKL